MRLYADYLHGEYGALDSDYVFVNLWAGPRGQPLAYPAVYDLVGRLRRRTGVAFGPHHFRHTYATWLLRRGAGMENVKQLLGHSVLVILSFSHSRVAVAALQIAIARLPGPARRVQPSLSSAANVSSGA